MTKYLEILYQALRTVGGIKVRTEDPDKLRQRLYVVRQQDPDLQALSLVISPKKPDSELWIINRSEMDDET